MLDTFILIYSLATLQQMYSSFRGTFFHFGLCLPLYFIHKLLLLFSQSLAYIGCQFP